MRAKLKPEEEDTAPVGVDDGLLPQHPSKSISWEEAEVMLNAARTISIGNGKLVWAHLPALSGNDHFELRDARGRDTLHHTILKEDNATVIAGVMAMTFVDSSGGRVTAHLLNEGGEVT